MSNKKRLMFGFASFTALMSIVIQIGFLLMNQQHTEHTSSNEHRYLTIIVAILPLVFLALSYYSKLIKTESQIPLYNSLSMTFASISMVVGANGMVEFHFSIFVVIAIIAFYEDIKLIIIMTVIFAIEHILGYWILTEFIFGNHEYTFSMMLIHAGFLIMMSAATIIHILSTRKVTLGLEEEKEQKQVLIQNTIDQLMLSSKKLVESVDSLSENTGRTMKANQEVTESMLNVSRGTDNQAQSSKESARAMEEMAIGIQRIAENSSAVSEAAQNMLKKSELGNESMEDTMQQLSKIKQSTDKVSQAVHDLENQSNEVESIAEIISEIAAQTNLLSLNASIEAARAGEHGRGFNVVATEVRKLASQTDHSAQKIAALIQKIQSSTSHVSILMKEGAEEVALGNSMVQNAKVSFETILESSKEVTFQIQEISAASEEMSAGSEQVTASIEDIANNSANTAIEVQRVSDSSLQTQISIDNMNNSTSDLNNLAHELNVLTESLSV
ncbi:methyl-accepting chemotaxis protein [Paenibacillus sp. 19GGS1-52]|uniref:methyl-accepting chemotaxis protein n=1 Tax=Paenibacillus sp. 19GGS1-52 TaxID=2758563 RepID=UPI001EFA733F|nr:methyl-accepting chemotaxis protein [Paenibacillus sp. 19GGS1-52]ULO05831.1 methyl-accepting chemotaxis protein [Paenibacillus sp. 19GGS1-52]